MTFSKASKHSAVHGPLIFSLYLSEEFLFRKCHLLHWWDRVLFSVGGWTLQVKGSHIYIVRCFASLQPHSLIAKTIGSFGDLNIIFTEPVCLETLQQQQKNKNKKKISLLSSKSESSCFSSHQSQLPTVSFKVFRWDVNSFTWWFTEVKVVKISS